MHCLHKDRERHIVHRGSEVMAVFNNFLEERLVNMKKIIAILCAVCAVFLLGVQTVCAQTVSTAKDSVNIDENTKNKLQLQTTDQVVQVYNTAIYFAFSEYDNVDEILASDEILGSYFIIKSANDEFISKSKIEDNYVSREPEFLNTKAMLTCMTGKATKYISSDVIVYNTYYLSGETSHMGTAIYYKTNKGDYVYYNHYKIGERLFPAEAFYAYQKAIINELSQYPDLEGDIDIGEIWDLSAYDFNSDTFDLFAPYPGQKVESKFPYHIVIPIGVVLLAAVATLGVVLYRKKKTT